MKCDGEEEHGEYISRKISEGEMGVTRENKCMSECGRRTRRERTPSVNPFFFGNESFIFRILARNNP